MRIIIDRIESLGRAIIRPYTCHLVKDLAMFTNINVSTYCPKISTSIGPLPLRRKQLFDKIRDQAKVTSHSNDYILIRFSLQDFGFGTVTLHVEEGQLKTDTDTLSEKRVEQTLILAADSLAATLIRLSE
jgi:hypothetical protein